MRRNLFILAVAFLILSVCGIYAFAQNNESTSVNRAVVREYVSNYNPFRDSRMWFVVQLHGSNCEWNIFIHPDNLNVVHDENGERVSLSASGTSRHSMDWYVLEANTATLYVVSEEDFEQWQNYVNYLREGLQRGLRHLPLTDNSERWDGRARLEVADPFWNHGNPLKIDVPFDGVNVVVDSNLTEGQAYVDALNAHRRLQPGTNQPEPGIAPYVHLETDSVTLYVSSEAEAREWCQRLERWQQEWDEEQNGPRRLPPPRIPPR